MAYSALTRAGVAGLVDYLAAAVAVVADLLGLHNSKGCALGCGDLTCAVANRTGFGACSLFRSATAAFLTVFNLCNPDGLFTALSRLLKGNIDRRRGVVSAPRCVGVSSSAPSEAAAEEGAEYIAQIVEIARKSAAVAAARAEVGVYPRVTELVVARPLFLIGKHLVSLVYLFKLLLGLLVAGV